MPDGYELLPLTSPLPFPPSSHSWDKKPLGLLLLPYLIHRGGNQTYHLLFTDDRFLQRWTREPAPASCLLPLAWCKSKTLTLLCHLLRTSLLLAWSETWSHKVFHSAKEVSKYTQTQTDSSLHTSQWPQIWVSVKIISTRDFTHLFLWLGWPNSSSQPWQVPLWVSIYVDL